MTKAEMLELRTLIEEYSPLNSDWGFRKGVMLKVLVRLAAQSAAPGGEPVAWPNGSNETVPQALRYLADHPRPAGGEQKFNAMHLYQLADEIEQMASRPLYAAQPHADGAREGSGDTGIADHPLLQVAYRALSDGKKPAGDAQTLGGAIKIANDVAFAARMKARAARRPSDRSKALGAEEAARQIAKALAALSVKPAGEAQGERADAKLIDAAPKLLEACASVWLMLSDTRDNELRLIADECREAIKIASTEPSRPNRSAGDTASPSQDRGGSA